MLVVKSNLRAQPSPSNPLTESQTPPKLLLIPYIPEVSERIERLCCPLGVRTVCKSRGTLRSSLVQVKQTRQDRKKKGVIYEVP